MSISTRLAKLERHGITGDIPVWCEEEDQVEATIDDMIKCNEIRASDRGRCVYWLNARCPAGDHERSLEELDRCA
jgi:hypothetical protein